MDNRASISLLEAFEDIQSRFIVNLPDAEVKSWERIFVQIEQGHWFYEDFYADKFSHLPHMSLKEFGMKMFELSPMLKDSCSRFDSLFDTFKSYLYTVPVFGCILLNVQMDKLLLLRNWKGNSWTFPRGKMNEGESEVDCALRETLEECGFDASSLLNPADFVEAKFNEQRCKLFLVSGVSEDFDFVTQTRKEISRIQWFEFDALPKHHWNVAPFLPRIASWIRAKQRGIKRGVSVASEQNERRREQRSSSPAFPSSPSGTIEVAWPDLLDPVSFPLLSPTASRAPSGSQALAVSGGEKIIVKNGVLASPRSAVPKTEKKMAKAQQFTILKKGEALPPRPQSAPPPHVHASPNQRPAPAPAPPKKRGSGTSFPVSISSGVVGVAGGGGGAGGFVSAGKISGKHNRHEMMEVADRDHANIDTFGVAASSWSVDEMFSTNETLTGRKFEYNGDPQSFGTYNGVVVNASAYKRISWHESGRAIASAGGGSTAGSSPASSSLGTPVFGSTPFSTPPLLPQPYNPAFSPGGAGSDPLGRFALPQAYDPAIVMSSLAAPPETAPAPPPSTSQPPVVPQRSWKSGGSGGIVPSRSGGGQGHRVVASHPALDVIPSRIVASAAGAVSASVPQLSVLGSMAPFSSGDSRKNSPIPLGGIADNLTDRAPALSTDPAELFGTFNFDMGSIMACVN